MILILHDSYLIRLQNWYSGCGAEACEFAHVHYQILNKHEQFFLAYFLMESSELGSALVVNPYLGNCP